MAETRQISQISGWRGRVATGIVDTAAEVLAADRDASMTDIAVAAGVGRATLYRYFLTREALLREMATAAIDELGGRLAEARLDDIPAREAFARVTRAVVTTGRKYMALDNLASEFIDAQAVERQITAPLEALLRRGAADGTLRDDLPAPILLAMLIGLLRSVTLSLRDDLGVEQASHGATSLFLDGAAPRTRDKQELSHQ
jgi:AcrR family transcriptional regulator